MKRHSEKGMALVITLMMLAITTFMAVVFLSLSRRERGNIKTIEEQMNARSMAEIGLARAQADLTAGMNNAVEADFARYSPQFGDTNAQKHMAIANRRVQRALLSYDLRTSRNFFNPGGFRMTEGKNPWNVSYFDSSRKSLVPGTDEWYQNIANLQYDPRPPVIVNDRGTNDFRFYIDLNRNGMFDPSEMQVVTGPNNEIYNSNGKVITGGQGVWGRFIGDPEWIGVLERPDLPHSETNRFIGRYAYIMMPTGKSLDMNFVHNLAIYDGASTNLNSNTSAMRYSRNQGVGSWELNMAGFLVDLHTNIWRTNLYIYTATQPASGLVFNDAVGLLQYRLNYSRANLLTPRDVFGPLVTNRWDNDLVDMAGDGPFVPYNDWYKSRPYADLGFAKLENDRDVRYWHGAERVDRTAEFPDVQRYFKFRRPSATTEESGFYNRFINAVASSKTNTYDRYAYYRMLAQMGADSKPALEGKIHLNFTNEPGRLSTNLVSWVSLTNNTTLPTTLPRQNTAVLVRRSDGGEEYQTRPNTLTNFFLMAADAMLRASLYTNVYIERYINDQPIWRTNYTVGSPYFERPEWSAVIDPQRQRRIIATPVRPDISITNIQIYHRTNALTAWRPNDLTYTNNEYSAAVHRILQLAANIYDNMTNNPGRTGLQRDVNDPFFPTVWRPLYNITETNITIIGWEPQVNAALALTHVQNNLFRSPHEYFTNFTSPVVITNISFYGQPWVIGVKKGWPNFNELSIETHAQITRKLEITKTDAEKGKPIPLTNYVDLVRRTRQIFMLGVSNAVGIEAWNSYALTNNRAIRIDTRVETRVGIDRVLARDTNAARSVLVYQPVFISPNVFVAETNSYIVPAGPGARKGWPGRQPKDFDPKTLADAIDPAGASDFRVPVYKMFTILTNSQYSEILAPQPFGTFFANPAQWQSLTTTQDFVISITNRVRYLATDVEENRVLDYVTFDNLVTKVDLDEAMRESLNAGNEVGGAGFNPALMWSKEPVIKGDLSGVSFGVMKQIEASLGTQPLSEAQWKDYSATARNEEEILKFQLFMNGTNNGAMSTATAAQVPFSPSRNLYLVSAYQANDPLVHYMPEDLRDRRRTTRPLILRLTQRAENAEIGKRNTFRQSIRWDAGEKGRGVEFQDPHVYESDDWQFPIAKLDNQSGGAYGITNFHYRYPNIGALGQIHRGTPWQTVYLKSRLPVNLDPTTTTSPTWVDWAGSYGTSPETDRKLIGLFTTAMSENAARGLLSINQTNTAAWSAVLSGVPVITNSWRNSEIRNNWKTPKFGVGNNGDDLLIQPNSPQLAAIVKGINDYRATRPLGLFGYLGEILGTPQLSIGPNWTNNNGIFASPFLNLHSNQVNDNNKVPDYAAFTDEAIEAIPARILSLLKEDEPRVTIYCFGQTLKPAPRSLVTSADYYNLCANYQVTGEYVTKAIVRVEGDIDARDIAIENDKNITDAQRQAWKLQRRPLKTVVESFDVLPPFE